MTLRVHDLTVTYDDLVAVSGVDLTVHDGEVVALLGPSGCGKSTLLRAVAGLERPAGGTVSWDGRDLTGVPPHRRGFGLVFQDGQLFPHRDVAGNVAFGLRMSGMDRAARRERVAELLELVGLAGYQRRRVTELSGGEQQRVALARALAPRPRLLLLDEPLSALDRTLREQLAVDLAALLREAGATALLVTHDHDEAFTLADRVAVMDAGRLRQVDTPDQVWRRPADERVAAFLGCGVLLPAEVTDGVARCALGEVPVDGVPDGPVRLGLHTGALRVAPEPGRAGSGAATPIVGWVLQRLHRRDHVRLLVRLEHLGEVEAVGPVAGSPAPGEEVHLVLDPVGVAVVPGAGDHPGTDQPSREAVPTTASDTPISR